VTFFQHHLLHEVFTSTSGVHSFVHQGLRNPSRRALMIRKLKVPIQTCGFLSLKQHGQRYIATLQAIQKPQGPFLHTPGLMSSSLILVNLFPNEIQGWIGSQSGHSLACRGTVSGVLSPTAKFTLSAGSVCTVYRSLYLTKVLIEYFLSLLVRVEEMNPIFTWHLN